MLDILKKVIHITLSSVVLIPLLTGCATSKTGIANRYQKEKVPEYALVDTRFSSGNLQTDTQNSELQREVLYALFKMGCEVDVLSQDDKCIKIQFGRPEAKGKLTMATLSDGAAAISNVKYTYRVNIVDYPSTVEQDHHVNRIANELAATLKKVDIIQNAVANTQ